MKPDPRPYIGPPLESDISACYALQALAAGVANEGQQKYALKYILDVLCGLDRPSYFGVADDNIYADGKRFVGHQIKLRIAVNISKLNQPKETPDVRSRRSNK